MGSLIYFCSHGAGGAIRMMLKNSDISFSDRGMGYGDWKEAKEEFSGDLPVWYFADDEDKWYY